MFPVTLSVPIIYSCRYVYDVYVNQIMTEWYAYSVHASIDLELCMIDSRKDLTARKLG